MKKKEQIYQTPQCRVCAEFLLAGSCLVALSVNECMITDSTPYFE